MLLLLLQLCSWWPVVAVEPVAVAVAAGQEQTNVGTRGLGRQGKARAVT